MKTPSYRHEKASAAPFFTGALRSQTGSTLVVGLVTLAVLSIVAAATFQTVTSRFRSNYQTASWHDALTSAETGVGYAFTRLRTPLTKPDPNNTANTSTSNTGTGTQLPGLVLTDPLKVAGSLQSDLATLSAGATCINGTVTTGTYNGATYTQIKLPTITIPHVGQGSTQFSATVTVDAIPSIVNSGVNTWYRIRSVGTVPLSGSASVGIQKYDNYLRKLQFHKDSFGNIVTHPQAVRTIEVIAKPVTIGSAALFGQTGINLNNQNIVIDSYDSRSTATSKPDGTYDPAKAIKTANVVTDDNPNSNGTPGVINLSPTGAYVNGNVATNDTPVQGSTGHVSGTVTEDFYQALPNPPDPNVVNTVWTGYSDTTTHMTTGTASAPTYYKISGSGDLKLTGNDNLQIDAPVSGEGYVQIWIPGQLSMAGNAQITIPAHVHVTFYIDGAASIAGNGIANNSLLPANVTLYGNHDPTISQSITVAGNGVFAGTIYAPSADVYAKGSGANGDIYGAIFSNNINFNGTTSLHYDQALGDNGAVIDYRVASWYEDNTLSR